MALTTSQQFIGGGVDLIVGGFTLQAAGTNTTLTTTGGTTNAISANQNNTIKGFTIGNTTGAKIAGTSVGALTIRTVTLQGSGADLALDTGAPDIIFDSVASTSSTTAISLTNLSGSVTINGSGTISGATTSAIVVNGGTVSLTDSGSITYTGSGSMISVLGGHATGTLAFNTGTLSAGSGGNGTGFSFNNADGTYHFNGTNTISNASTGIDITNGSAGTFLFSSNTSITGPNNAAYNEITSTANVTYNGTITKIQNDVTGLTINLKTGGATAFTGQVTLAAGLNTPVNLTSNTGGTINFTGGLDITTNNGGTGFTASGGGTINVTGAGNTIATTTGQILNWSGVSVGSSGVTFATLQSTGTVPNNALVLNNVNGTGNTFSGGAVTIAASSSANGIVITAGSSATFTFASATIGTTAGTIANFGIILSGANGPVTFTTVDIDGTAESAIAILNNTNAVNVNGGTIGATAEAGTSGNPAVNLDGGSANVTIAASITDTSAASVEVHNITGGVITFSGAITQNTGLTGVVDSTAISVHDNTGGSTTFSGSAKTLNTGIQAAVNLTTNTGHTINFTNGGLDIDTTSGTGFNATGGGTVNVTGNNNTINSTNGTALNVANTTIGSSNLNFQSISAGNNNAGADPANGIVLNNTGTSGGLTVSGDGGGSNNGSGGTIQATTGDGISLTTTENVRLGYMNIINNLGDGIGGSGINGFVLTRVNITGNGNDAATDESGINIANLTGSASGGARPTSIVNSVISNNNEFEVQITNSSGTLTDLTMSGNTISSNGLPINGNGSSPHGNLVNFLGGGTSVMTLTVTSGSFTGNWTPATPLPPPATISGTAISAVTQGTTHTVNVFNTTFTNNNAGVDVSTTNASTTFTANVSNNDFQGTRAIAINSFHNGNPPFTRTYNATFTNNVIGTAGTANSGSYNGRGIDISNEGAINATYLISENIINEVGTLGSAGAEGIGVNVGLGGLATAGGTTNVTIVDNTIANIRNSRGHDHPGQSGSELRSVPDHLCEHFEQHFFRRHLGPGRQWPVHANQGAQWHRQGHPSTGDRCGDSHGVGRCEWVQRPDQNLY